MRSLRFCHSTFLIICLASIVCVWAPGQTAQAACDNKIGTNGSFEQPDVTGNFVHIVPSPHDPFPGWSLVKGNSIEIQRTATAKYGTQYLELASDGPTEVSKRLNTEPGFVYELRFAYRPRPGKSVTDSQFRVWLNDRDKQLGEYLDTDDGTWEGWRWAKHTIVGSGQPITISFEDVSQGGHVDAGAFIDNVQFCKVRKAPSTCCCGANAVYSDSPYPHLTWALQTNGDFVRLWWDQESYQEQVRYPISDAPILPGTIQRNPFGHGAIALNERGDIVAVVRRNGKWTTDLVLPRRVAFDFGGVRPCLLLAATEGDYRGIWAVTDSQLLWIYKDEDRDDATWKYVSVDMGGHAERVAPGSLWADYEGRVGGLLKSGQKWGVWHENEDPQQLRFDYSLPTDIVVPPPTNCQSRSIAN